MKRNFKNRFWVTVVAASMITSIIPVGALASAEDIHGVYMDTVEGLEDNIEILSDLEKNSLEVAEELVEVKETLVVEERNEDVVFEVKDFVQLLDEDDQSTESISQMNTEAMEETEFALESSDISIEEIALLEDEFVLEPADVSNEEITLLEEEPMQILSGEGYVLMNIPYEQFYAVAGTSNNNGIDAISSATNKVGNYGKSGGAYHSGKSAEIAEDGTVTAVGGANGAKNEGVSKTKFFAGWNTQAKQQKTQDNKNST